MSVCVASHSKYLQCRMYRNIQNVCRQKASNPPQPISLFICSGYDYYTPEKSVAFHMYAIHENRAKRKKVKLFWENGDLYPGSAVEGMKRLNGIIGMGNPGDTYYHGQEEEYGLGQVRPKEKFFKLYGIHTDTQTVEDHLCRFVGKPMQSYFKPHLRSNGMGINLDEIDFEYVDKTKAKGGKK